jgi:4-amino-4-deoxy-L-arabinose transferase-like glycosyltransferase
MDTMTTMATRLTVALLCGTAVTATYYVGRRPSKKRSHRLTFALVPLAMTTALATRVVGDDLARAFGLVGAMSLIKFRLALKDPQDLAAVFLALALGMACGVGLLGEAVAGAVLVNAALLLTVRAARWWPRWKKKRKDQQDG